MVKTHRPQVYEGEEALLKELNPDYENPDDEDAEEDNQVRQKLAVQQNMIQEVNDQLYGNVSGMGYLRAPNAMGRGYLSAPNVAGGWIQIPMMLAGLVSSLFGKGVGGAGSMRYVGMAHHPNLSSASAFYRDMVQQAMGQGINPRLLHGKMEKLFGGKPMYRSIVTGKVGSGVQQRLKMGHLLAPVLLGHLKTALRGTGMSPEQVMSIIEEKMPDIMELEVTPEVMARGGSILGSIWSGLKGVVGRVLPFLGNLFKKPGVQKLIKDVGSKVSGVAERELPTIAEKATEKLANYAKKKLTGDEPSPTPSRKKTYDDIDDDDEGSSSSAIERFEQPSAVHDDSVRRDIINQRKRQSSVVPAESIPSKAPQIVGWDRGHPIFASGMGKKKVRVQGGAWTVRLDED